MATRSQHSPVCRLCCRHTSHGPIQQHEPPPKMPHTDTASRHVSGSPGRGRSDRGVEGANKGGTPRLFFCSFLPVLLLALLLALAPHDSSSPHEMDQQQDPSRASTGDYYFDSYTHFGIHEEMLKDEVRTVSYRNAIYRNRHLFEGKTVLDVGCGTGILSMFAAKAGAKLVIGVDMSGMIEHARTIVRANGLDDRVVLLRGKMEEVQLPVDKVDIIISEWMGYFLLYESMLDTVLFARDKYLVQGGLILPDRATMHLAAIEDAEYKEKKIHFWDDVYGFDMSCIRSVALREPLVDTVESKAVISTDAVIKEIDIATVRKEDLAFASDFSLTVTKADWAHALIVWFAVSFPGDGSRAVAFSTGPYDRYTHWKQTVLYLPEDLELELDDKIAGAITCKPAAFNPRSLDIGITYARQGKRPTQPVAYSYQMA